MLTVSNVSKRFGDHLVLDRISFTINRGDRIGLVGPNGSGKSTLVSMLSKRLLPDAGAVSYQPGVTLGYLRQGFADLQGGTLRALLDEQMEGLLSAALALERATATLGHVATPEVEVLKKLAARSEEFERLGGYAAVDELSTLLAIVGLDCVAFDTPLSRLSGGEKTRAGLAALLSARPDLLLLDEPTNHLDLDALLWLENYVSRYRGALVIVSHDRAFIDKTATGILELSDITHKATTYPGNYSAYLEAKQRAEQSQLETFERQRKEVLRIERDIRAVASHGQRTESQTTNDYVRGRAKQVARTAKVRARKLEKLLDSTDRAESPEKRWGLALELDPSQQTGRDVIAVRALSVTLGGRSVLDGVDLHVSSGERIALTGPNGAGKSTLLRIISGQLAPTSGNVRLGAGVEFGVFDQEQESVDLTRSALDQLRSVGPGEESEIRAFLHKFLFTEHQVAQCAGELSYGERARLSLALLVRRGANVLLLDEPLNHLDLDSRQRFEQALIGFQGTMIAVLHDRFAISRLATRSLELREGKLRELWDVNGDAGHRKQPARNT